MKKIEEFLRRRFPQGPVAQSHYSDLLRAFMDSGLAPPNLAQDVLSGNDGQLSVHLWEAMLYRYLSDLGFTFRRDGVRKSGQHGPDFGIIHEGQTIWIEAVAPSPEGVPEEWLAPPTRGEFKVKTKPHEQMLLRWTSVLRDKRDVLARYVDKKIIAATDCTVIAVNSCRLSDFPGDDNGISQLPFAVEAVFPVGPLAVPITPEGRLAGEAANVPRFSIRKPSGANVPTTNFLDSLYANVSAIMGTNRRDMINGVLPLTVVHNPLATTPLPRTLLRAYKEFVADDNGDDSYTLRPLSDAQG
jgi:hypothetical protein